MVALGHIDQLQRRSIRAACTRKQTTRNADYDANDPLPILCRPVDSGPVRWFLPFADPRINSGHSRDKPRCVAGRLHDISFAGTLYLGHGGSSALSMHACKHRRNQSDLGANASPVEGRILFFRPVGADWTPTDLWQRAVAIPGVKATWDEGGVEATRFGAYTSGHTLLFNREGNLLFSGGVTSSRGHVGPSKGNLSLTAWLTPGEVGDAGTLVFGCSLSNSPSKCTKGIEACQNPQ